MAGLNRILVIDDEASIRESLEMFLREKGLNVQTAGNAEAGIGKWRRLGPQVIILDIRLPDRSGLDVLAEIAAKDREVKVIMITAHHDMETTIAAMRKGAYDYIHKPLDVEELERALDKALHIARTTMSTAPLVGSEEPPPGRKLVGNTPAMREIFKSIGLLSKNQATVLIQGETGTGKELIARIIHDSSDFKDEPFVTVDCTTLVENLLESELFGYEKGAFTGASETKPGRLELAGKGTIFFDEVGDLPPSLQAKLLRFLEYRQFTRVGGGAAIRSQARIIAATNRDLDRMVSQGSFRQDLLFRLKVISMAVPPLKDRVDDLSDLMKYWLARINHEMNLRVTRMESGVMESLAAYPWPGNVRELKNVLTKAALESRGELLLADTVKACLAAPVESENRIRPRTLEEVEKEHIIKALERFGWNQSAASRALGISRPTLRKRLKVYGLQA